MNGQIVNKKDTSILLIIYQIAIYILMISGYKGVAYYISFGFIGLFVLKIFINTNGKVPTNKSWNSFMLFLVFYSVTSIYYFDKRNFYVYLIYYTIIFFPLLIFEYLKTRSTSEMMVKSLKSFTIVLVGFCLIAIGYYWANPGLAREMASHQVEGKLAIGGGYSLAYAAAIMCVYLFSKMINKRIDKKIHYIVICIICAYLVYLTESSLTFFAMFVGLLVSIIAKGKETDRDTTKDIVKFVFIGAVFVIIASVVIYNKYSIANWVLDFTAGKEDNIVYSRIEEVINELVYGKSTAHFEKRSGTLTDSIEIFKKNPIIGMGYKYGNVFSLGKQLGMGNHSEILDAFARYGVIGGCFWLTPYFVTLKKIFNKNFGCVITILMMMYFNPFVSFHSNTMMFLFIPLFEEILDRRDKKDVMSEVG